MFRLKRTKADKLFSDIVRLRANYNCERCGKHYDPPTPYIQTSHFYGRKGLSTRYDFDNVAALCGTIGFPGGCHGYFQDHPNEHREFFLKKLGQKKYDALVLRAHTPTKIDEKALVIAFKKELEMMNSQIIGYRPKK